MMGLASKYCSQLHDAMFTMQMYKEILLQIFLNKFWLLLVIQQKHCATFSYIFYFSLSHMRVFVYLLTIAVLFIVAQIGKKNLQRQLFIILLVPPWVYPDVVFREMLTVLLHNGGFYNGCFTNGAYKLNKCIIKLSCLQLIEDKR